MADRGVLIVGVGGLGVPAACALVREGVRRLGLVDPDPIELSNLARQIVYRADDIGTPKVIAAARELRSIFGELDRDSAALCHSERSEESHATDARSSAFSRRRELVIDEHHFALDSTNAAALVRRYDFVIDGTDNPAAKFLINDACLDAHVPFVYGGVIGFTGQAMTVLPGETPCLRCLFEQPPDEAEVASCREAGIVGPVAGMIGEIEALEAIASLKGIRPELAGRILTYDGTVASRIRKTIVRARRGCACGAWRRAESDQASARANLRMGT